MRRVREDILREGGFEWFWKKRRNRNGMGRGKARFKTRGGQGLQVLISKNSGCIYLSTYYVPGLC